MAQMHADDLRRSIQSEKSAFLFISRGATQCIGLFPKLTESQAADFYLIPLEVTVSPTSAGYSRDGMRRDRFSN
jgi:hypothetical protein